MPRRGRSSARYQIWPATCGRKSRPRTWSVWPMPKVTLKPRGASKKPNEKCLQNSGGRKARETDGCGNDGPWTPRKTKGRFSSAPTALGNRTQRDSHISTAPARRGKVENQKQVSHFPTCCLCYQKKSKD